MDCIWNKDGEKEMTDVALFDTVPKQDYLSLFPSSGTDYQKVVKLLDFEKKDVARASNIAVQSVRYDPPKMPKELADRIQEWAVALSLVAEFFKDQQKTILWFKTPNPLLGDVTPRDMIRVGRFKKLRQFILRALSENER
jgi:hypothetical protein